MVRHSLLLAVAFISGCAGIANSPLVINELKVRSAGFTGCAVDANVITNVTGTTWNATCKDKVYLCSAGSGNSSTYSCAIAVN